MRFRILSFLYEEGKLLYKMCTKKYLRLNIKGDVYHLELNGTISKNRNNFKKIVGLNIRNKI